MQIKNNIKANNMPIRKREINSISHVRLSSLLSFFYSFIFFLLKRQISLNPFTIVCPEVEEDTK